jgi:hypothetical protein
MSFAQLHVEQPRHPFTMSATCCDYSNTAVFFPRHSGLTGANFALSPTISSLSRSLSKRRSGKRGSPGSVCSRDSGYCSVKSSRTNSSDTYHRSTALSSLHQWPPRSLGKPQWYLPAPNNSRTVCHPLQQYVDSRPTLDKPTKVNSTTSKDPGLWNCDQKRYIKFPECPYRLWLPAVGTGEFLTNLARDSVDDSLDALRSLYLGGSKPHSDNTQLVTNVSSTPSGKGPELSQSPSQAEIASMDNARELLSTAGTSKSGNSNSEGEQSFLGAEDSLGWDSPQVIDAAALRCLEHLACRIVRRCLQNINQSKIRSCAPSQADSSSISSHSSSSQTPPTSFTSTGPPRHGGDDGLEDSDDQGNGSGSSKLKRKREDEEQKTKLLACPYAKFDSSRYSQQNNTELNYRKCSSVCLRDISRVKQHLYRVHARPKYYCGACYDSFETRDHLDLHSKQRPACDLKPAKYEERMTDIQFQAVKKRVLRGDPCDLWYGIYDTLFPHAPRPASPYVSSSDPAMINHFVNLFLHLGPEEMLDMMRDRREQVGRHPLLDLSTQTIVDEAFEIALPMYVNALASRQSPPGDQVPARDAEMQTDETTPTPFQRHEPTGLRSYQDAIAPPPISDQSTSATTQWLYNDIQDPTELPLQPIRSMSDQFYTQPFTMQAWQEPLFDPSEVNSAFERYGQVVYPSFQLLDHPATRPRVQTGLSGDFSGV